MANKSLFGNRKAQSAQNMAANEDGLNLWQEMRNFRSAQEERNKENERRLQEHKHQLQSLQASRRRWLDVRQRAVMTWVQDTEARKEGTRKLNPDIVHAGDIQHDAMVITERFKKTSTEWASFRDLYGMTLEEWNHIGLFIDSFGLFYH